MAAKYASAPGGEAAASFSDPETRSTLPVWSSVAEIGLIGIWYGSDVQTPVTCGMLAGQLWAPTADGWRNAATRKTSRRLRKQGRRGDKPGIRISSGRLFRGWDATGKSEVALQRTNTNLRSPTHLSPVSHGTSSVNRFRSAHCSSVAAQVIVQRRPDRRDGRAGALRAA